MTNYRFRKTVDVVLQADEDDDVRIGGLVGRSGSGPAGLYWSVSELRDSGWEVTTITTPVTDPAGTVRRFNATGDKAIKALDGSWWYIDEAGSYGKVTPLDLKTCASDVVS